MNKNKLKTPIILTTAVILMASFIFYFGRIIYHERNEDVQVFEDFKIKEYDALFKASFLNGLTSYISFVPAKGFSSLKLKFKDSFDIVVTKVAASASDQLDDLLFLRAEDVPNDFLSIYTSTPIGRFKYYFKDMNDDKATRFILSVNSDAIKQSSISDSLFLFSGNTDAVSLTTEPDSKRRIIMFANNLNPMQIVFFKKRESVYYIFCSPVDKIDAMPADFLLRNMIK